MLGRRSWLESRLCLASTTSLSALKFRQLPHMFSFSWGIFLLSAEQSSVVWKIVLRSPRRFRDACGAVAIARRIRAGGCPRGLRRCERNKSCAEWRRLAHDYSVGVRHWQGYPRDCWKTRSRGERRGGRWAEQRLIASVSRQYTGRTTGARHGVRGRATANVSVSN